MQNIKHNIKLFLVALKIFLLSGMAMGGENFKFVDKAVWGIFNGPLELSGICNVSSNEYACVSDSGGKIYSFFIDDTKLDSPDYVPLAESFKLIQEDAGFDLEGCVYVDDAIFSIDESNSTIKVLYPRDGAFVSVPLHIRNFKPNCGFESLAYYPSKKLFVTCTEQAMYGVPPRQVKLIFFTMDIKKRKCKIMYEIPYLIDEFYGKNVYRNGVSDLYVWDETTLLVVERATDLDGRIPSTRIRIYAVKLNDLDKSFTDNSLKKQLVYEYESKIVPANIEGICRIPKTDKLIAVHDLPGLCVVGLLGVEATE